jgi:hypothetical protein
MEKTLKELIAEMDSIEGNNRIDEAIGTMLILNKLFGVNFSQGEPSGVRGGRGQVNPTAVDSKRAELQAIDGEIEQHSRSQPDVNSNEWLAWNQKSLEILDKYLNTMQDIRSLVANRSNSTRPVSAADIRQQGDFINDLDQQINR